MKNKVKISFVIIIIISMIYFIVNIPEKIDTNIQVINKTQKDIYADINISLGLENSSTISSIYSLKNIDSNSKKKSKKSIDHVQGDYAIIIKVNDSATSFYYPSGTKLSQVDIDLEIVDTVDGNIMVQGSLTRKNLIGIKTTEQIKPTTINVNTEYTYE